MGEEYFLGTWALPFFTCLAINELFYVWQSFIKYVTGSTGSHLIIRTCTVDGGSKTSDLELIRTGSRVSDSSSRSMIIYQYNNTKQFYLYGTIDICDGADGCNSGMKNFPKLEIIRILVIIHLFFCKITLWKLEIKYDLVNDIKNDNIADYQWWFK